MGQQPSDWFSLHFAGFSPNYGTLAGNLHAYCEEIPSIRTLVLVYGCARTSMRVRLDCKGILVQASSSFEQRQPLKTVR